jgi:hypothetical protein
MEYQAIPQLRGQIGLTVQAIGPGQIRPDPTTHQETCNLKRLIKTALEGYKVTSGPTNSDWRFAGASVGSHFFG